MAPMLLVAAGHSLIVRKAAVAISALEVRLTALSIACLARSGQGHCQLTMQGHFQSVMKCRAAAAAAAAATTAAAAAAK